MALDYSSMIEDDKSKNENGDMSNEEFLLKSYKEGTNKLGNFLTQLNVDEHKKEENNTTNKNEGSSFLLDPSFSSNVDDNKSDDFLNSLKNNKETKFGDINLDLDLDEDEDINDMLKLIQETQAKSKSNNSGDSLLGGKSLLDEIMKSDDNEDNSIEDIEIETTDGDISLEETILMSERDIEAEINSLDSNLESIDNFKFEDIENTVKNYLTAPNNLSLNHQDYNLEIKEILKSSIQNSEMIALFNVLNLNENKKLVGSDIDKIKSKLQSDYENIKNEVTSNKEVVHRKVVNYLEKSSGDIRKIYNIELHKLTKFRSDVVQYLDVNKKKVINTEINKQSDLFNRVEEITKEVEEIKSTIMRIMGKNFVKVKDEKIKMPRNERELNKLLDRVGREVEQLEIRDKSQYDRLMTKAMKIIFAPTRYTNNEMKSVITLMNVLGFLFLAIKFRDLFVIAFTSTIIIDLVNQIKMSKKNINADFIVEFAMKSNDIINNITDNIISSSTKELDAENKRLLIKLDKKIAHLTDKLTTSLENKEKEINTTFDKDSLIEEINKKYQRSMKAIERRLEDVRFNMQDSINTIEERIEFQLNQAYRTAREIKNKDIFEEGNRGQLTFKPTVKVGRYSIENGKYGFDFSRNFREGSYLVRVDDKDMKIDALEKIKCVLVQHLTHIKPEFLRINLIDVKEMGNDFIEMVSENENITKLYPNDEALREHLKLTVKEIEKRYKVATKEYESITEYNEKMIELNESTFKYEINLFYNFNVDLIKNGNFRTLMSEGGKSGLSSIVIVEDEELLDNRGETNQELVNSLNCFDYNVYYDGRWKSGKGNKSTVPNGSIIPNITHLESESVQFDRNDMLMKIRNLEYIIEESKKDMVFYEDLERQYARELFTKNTLTGIEICTGFRDGNLSKPEYLTIGDELVHALMAGKTGAGKSNTINVILMNLLRSYSPEWLELYMIDFKNLEFNFYTKTVETSAYTKKICELPHTSMIAGTTDGEYSLSVFKSALSNMERRKKKLAKGIKHNGQIFTFKKIEDYNRFVLDNDLKMEYPIIPRLLIMLDEFQVMFTIDDDAVKDQAKINIQRLAKEARAMGIHMFFTSQSMEGTLSTDILNQFAMRWCLSASAETSKEVLGNDASSKLTGKGFIYFSGTMERKVEDNQLFKVPFIPPDYTKKVMKQVIDESKRLKSINDNIPFYEADFYDESAIHSHKELKAYLNHPSISKSRNAVLLGQKVVYKETSTPEHFMLGSDDGDNILVMGNEKLALSNLINNITDNLASKERTKILIANFDRTMDGFINLENSSEGTEYFNRCSDPLELFEDVCGIMGISMKPFDPILDDEEDSPENLPPYNPDVDNRWVVVIIGLNKGQGFNEDYVEDNYMQPLLNILKNGPSKGVNIVLNYKPPFRANKILPQFSHRVASKLDEDTSFEVFGGRKAKNLFTDKGLAFGMYRSMIDDRELKFKIYNFEYSKDLLKPKELESVTI